MNPDLAYLEHIRQAAGRALEYTHGGRAVFLTTPLVQDGVIRNLEVIGEATKKLSSELRQRHPDIPWGRMAGMRDVLIHNYLGVDLGLVWDVVEHRIPELLSRVDAVLRAERAQSADDAKA